MKLQTWAVAALCACALAAGGRLHARQDANGEGLEPQAEHADHFDGMDSEYSSYGQADMGACCDEGCTPCCGGGGGGGFMDRPISLVFGAEYIYARASFSEALAFVQQDLINGTDTFVEHDFDFESSFSVYGGIYLVDCGGAVIFEYTELNSSSEFFATDFGNPDINVFGPYEIDGTIEGFADVDVQSYDLSFAKTIPLGCALACPKGCGDCCDECCDECCDDCCNSCCGWCPAWDLTFSAGFRYAEVDWARGLTAFDPLNNLAFIDSAVSTMDFEGWGGRIGLMGRRYIGRRGLFSVYGKGDWSILFGEMETNVAVTNVAGTAFILNEADRIIPVTEIELGGTAHLGARASVSAGYFWAAWHDLGMRDTYAFPQFQLSHYDDANILGFDGFFARAEVTF
jgi:hypothetical protein